MHTAVVACLALALSALTEGLLAQTAEVPALTTPSNEPVTCRPPTPSLARDSTRIVRGFVIGDVIRGPSRSLDVIFAAGGVPVGLQEVRYSTDSSGTLTTQLYFVRFGPSDSAVGVSAMLRGADRSPGQASELRDRARPLALTSAQRDGAVALARWAWSFNCPQAPEGASNAQHQVRAPEGGDLSSAADRDRIGQASSRRSLMLLYAGLFFTLAISAFAWAVIQKMRLRQARAWPRTEGTARRSEGVTHRRFGFGWNKQRYTFGTGVAFLYDVGGRLYTTDRYQFGDTPRLRPARVPPVNDGDLVTVHYHASKPHQAVVRVDGVARFRSALLLGTTYLVLAALFAWIVDHGVIESSVRLRRFAIFAAFFPFFIWATR